MTAMTSDPEDYVYVEKQVGGDRRRTRRHVTIADRDWRPVGDPAAPGGAAGRLRAPMVINMIALDVELESCELTDHDASGSQGRSVQRRRALATLRARGRGMPVGVRGRLTPEVVRAFGEARGATLLPAVPEKPSSGPSGFRWKAGQSGPREGALGPGSGARAGKTNARTGRLVAVPRRSRGPRSVLPERTLRPHDALRGRLHALLLQRRSWALVVG